MLVGQSKMASGYWFSVTTYLHSPRRYCMTGRLTTCEYTFLMSIFYFNSFSWRSTITFNLATVIFLNLKSIPPILRALPTIPNIALMNIMACRVFRNTMLGIHRETEITTSLIEREIGAIHPVISLSLSREGSGNASKPSRNPSLDNAADRSCTPTTVV